VAFAIDVVSLNISNFVRSHSCLCSVLMICITFLTAWLEHSEDTVTRTFWRHGD